MPRCSVAATVYANIDVTVLVVEILGLVRPAKNKKGNMII